MFSKYYIRKSKDPFSGKEVDEYYVSHKEIDVSPPVHKKEKFFTDRRAIISGDVIEIIEYEEPIFYGAENTFQQGKIRSENRKTADNINKSKMTLRRLINTNYNSDSKFVTLTFRENLKDIDVAKDNFKKFVKKMNYRRKKEGLENLKYIYVVEFQKRGAIHFHCIFFNMEYIENDKITEIWSHGFTKINSLKDCDNVGAYVVKYMSKALEDDRLNNRDLYGRSKGNLKEPIILKKACEVRALQQAYKDKTIYFQSYDTNYRGEVTYSQINLKRTPQKMVALYNQSKERRDKYFKYKTFATKLEGEPIKK